MYRVIDVSNGVVDMQAVKNSGIDGVIIRAGYGSDASQVDSGFEENYNRAKEAGLMIGCYWFCYARNNDDAKAEADACNQVIQGMDFPLGIYYDYEEDSIAYMDRCGSSKDDFTGRLVAWIERMLELGWKRVRWYANPSCIAGKNGADELDQSRLQPYGLWLACYNDSYADNPITDFQGYSLCGHQWMNSNVWDVQGVGDCDTNYFYSTALDYTDVVATSQQEETAPEQEVTQQTVESEDNNTYTVQPNDCLGVIAQNLGVNMYDLANLNGIQDINKIKTGTVLQIPGKVAPVQQQEEGSTYTVQPGECLSVIAQKFGVDTNELARINGIIDIDDIQAGQVLKLN